MFKTIKQMVAAVLGSGTQSQEGQSTRRSTHGIEPTFLLPETREHYRQLRRNAIQVIRDEITAIETEAARLSVEAEELESREGGAAVREINRRQAQPLRERAEYMLRYDRSYRSSALSELEELERPDNYRTNRHEKAARDEEWSRIAHEGAVLRQDFADETRASGQTTNYEGVVDRKERRLVRWTDDQVFLVGLRHPALTEVSGTETGSFGYMGRPAARTIYAPTGEYGPPEVEFVTNGLAQFNQAELALLALRDKAKSADINTEL